MDTNFFKKRIFAQGATVGILRAFSLLCGFATAVILARLLGLEGLGVYASALAVLTLLTLPLEFGLPALIIREVAKGGGAKGNPEAVGLFYFSGGLLALSFFPLALVGFFVISLSPWAEFMAGYRYWWLILLYILFSGVGSVFSAFLAGSKFLVLAQFPSLLIKPTALIIALVIIHYIFDRNLTPIIVLFVQTLSALVTSLVSAIILIVKFFRSFFEVKPIYRAGDWIESAWKLGLINAVRRGQPQILIYILSLLSTPDAVGLLRICQRGASLVAFGTSVVTTTSMPYVSSLLHQSYERLQRLLTNAARIMSFWALSCLLIIILFGEQLLGFVFGDEFRSAYLVLVVFCIVEVVKAYFGMSMVLLNMARKERVHLQIALIGLLASILGTIGLAPSYGAIGCAIAYAFSSTVVFWAANNQCGKLLNLKTGAVSNLFRNDRIKNE